MLRRCSQPLISQITRPCKAGADAAVKSGADELLMSYNIMLAASASFMSPFGYTTNLLIYGPGKRANCSSCLLCLGYIAQTMPSLPPIYLNVVIRSKILCTLALPCNLFCGLSQFLYSPLLILYRGGFLGCGRLECLFWFPWYLSFRLW